MSTHMGQKSGTEALRSTTTVGRVRQYLHRLSSDRNEREDWQSRHDLRSLLARLGRGQARGKIPAGVELSPHMASALQANRIVGNEVLILDHARKRA